MARANALYYATNDPFRDFTTAPEITQVFGELLGAWAAVTWEVMGRPDPVLLVECGPGRGTLMQDALRAVTAVAPEFRAALDLHLIETSPRLRALQADRLPAATHHDSIDTLPALPLILLANEFLDALPIRQFVRRGQAWTERHVKNGTFVEFPTPEPSPPPAHEPSPSGRGQGEGRATRRNSNSDGSNHPHPDPHPEGEGVEGQIIERSDAAHAFIAALARRLRDQGGAALILDYGPSASAP
ncbi:MAG TPA: SAM-dependent methyltransferase, partial [Acetobacteraceae bacterium]|nr:SAM-dependent methyltransferase [Acetobacteraceae bacterium]